MATVSEQSITLSRLIGDPVAAATTDGEVWTSAQRTEALNIAQKELTLSLLTLRGKVEMADSLLTEIQVIENVSIGTTGYAFSSLVTRNYLANGFVGLKATINNQNVWAELINIAALRFTENHYMKGTDDTPNAYVFAGKIYIQADVGSFPVSCDLYYFGEPFKLGTSTAGSGKTQTVTTSNLNVILHDVITIMAERWLRQERGDPTDFQEVAVVDSIIQRWTQQLISGVMPTNEEFVNRQTAGR